MKYRNADTKHYMDAVARIGCIACRKEGIYGTPAVLHHPRSKAGMAERGSDDDVYPLCPSHHVGQGQRRGFPSVHGNPDEFHALYGTDEELSSEAREEVEISF